jgi:lipopolysaccharide biosynthesis regulator YciM
MKLRTFLTILAVLALVGVFFVFALDAHNQRLLSGERFNLWRQTQVTVGWALLWAFMGGAGIAVVLGFSREAGRLVDRWRRRRASQKSEEIEEEYTRGLVAVLEGRDDEAVRHFRAVLERDSRHFNTLIKLGEVLRAQGSHADAIEYHRKAHHLKEDDTRPLYALVEDHEARGDMERALNVLGRIIAINKHSIVAWRRLRSLQMKQANWERALEAHQRVEKLSNPDDPRDAADRRFGVGIRYEIASAALAAGKIKDATTGLRRLVAAERSFIPAHVLLGEALVRAGQEQEALETWYAGFETTGSPIFLHVLEEHFLGREQPLAAIEALKRCISRTRKDALARFYLGKLYVRLEMLDDALTVLSSLEQRAAHAPMLHYLLGRVHERRRHHAEAARHYRKVIGAMELVRVDYECRHCHEGQTEWVDRCPSCREWNTIELNFREELPPEELGLAPAPIYTARS